MSSAPAARRSGRCDEKKAAAPGSDTPARRPCSRRLGAAGGVAGGSEARSGRVGGGAAACAAAPSAAQRAAARSRRPPIMAWVCRGLRRRERSGAEFEDDLACLSWSIAKPSVRNRALLYLIKVADEVAHYCSADASREALVAAGRAVREDGVEEWKRRVNEMKKKVGAAAQDTPESSAASPPRAPAPGAPGAARAPGSAAAAPSASHCTAGSCSAAASAGKASR